MLKLDQRFYPNLQDYYQRPRYLTWDINKMITPFLYYNSRTSSDIPGASLEFENFISQESANVIRGIEVIYIHSSFTLC